MFGGSAIDNVQRGHALVSRIVAVSFGSDGHGGLVRMIAPVPRETERMLGRIGVLVVVAVVIVVSIVLMLMLILTVGG